MGGSVSCFSPSDEEYELSKARFPPNHRLPNESGVNVSMTGRNTNSMVRMDEPLQSAKAVVSNCTEEPQSGALGDIPASKSSAGGSSGGRSSGSKELRPLIPQFRAEMLGYTMKTNGARYTMFVRNVNNSFADVDRILSQRLLLGLQRRYGCRMQQHDEVALFRGNEVRLATIDGPSRSHICKFRSALPTSLTRFLITGVNHSADVDDVLDTN